MEAVLGFFPFLPEAQTDAMFSSFNESAIGTVDWLNGRDLKQRHALLRRRSHSHEGIQTPLVSITDILLSTISFMVLPELVYFPEEGNNKVTKVIEDDRWKETTFLNQTHINLIAKHFHGFFFCLIAQVSGIAYTHLD